MTFHSPAPPVPDELDPKPHLPLFPGPGHTVIAGYGKLGEAVGKALTAAGRKFIVIENDPHVIEKLEGGALPVVDGNAIDIDSLRLAGVEIARWLVVTAPDVFEAGQIVERCRRLNPKLAIIARAHSTAEAEHLQHHGADKVIVGETGFAEAMMQWLAAEDEPAELSS
jgi:K+:H+ antiporter